LIDAGGKIVSREDLLRVISRNPQETDLRSVDALVSRLRRKLGDAPDDGRLILTAPGFGYRLAQAPRPA
jgi:DNA-binding response OmpR family regulator